MNVWILFKRENMQMILMIEWRNQNCWIKFEDKLYYSYRDMIYEEKEKFWIFKNYLTIRTLKSLWVIYLLYKKMLVCSIIYKFYELLRELKVLRVIRELFWLLDYYSCVLETLILWHMIPIFGIVTTCSLRKGYLEHKNCDHMLHPTLPKYQ